MPIVYEYAGQVPYTLVIRRPQVTRRLKRMLRTRLAYLRTKWTRPSRFLGLPPEIRNLIYEYTITAKGTLYVGTYDFWSLSRYNLVADSGSQWHEGRRAFRYPTLPVQPPVTKVCRQLRAETLTTFYAVNSFAVKIAELDREDNANIFVQWSKVIGMANRQAISRLYICDHKELGRGKTVKEIVTNAQLSWAAGAVEVRTSRMKVKEDDILYWGLDQCRLLEELNSA
ncbi:hypothetical protein LTR27_004269 [Elasticomyces elasticus]|nr:hypothetical protein LTR27_004269 [Elasticomyces elasticus]